MHCSSSTLRIKLPFIAFFLIFTTALYSQELPVAIKITNTKKEPISFATITVINRLDTTIQYKKVADSTGTARFVLAKGKQYTVKVSAINYQPFEKGISTTGNQSSFSFTADPVGKTLDAAIVRSTKPLMKQEDDKTIIDPENLVAASTSGYEVIEKTPGLFVDQDGNIYISSLTPATVQINGREMKMSAADVATMLKSLPPTAISKIEVVRTPSAKYDASGSGGVVNVVLKKGVKIGITGSISAGMQQGVYGNQFAGFNLNNNTGQKSYYLNMNISRRNNYERIKTDRYFGDTTLGQNAFTKYPATVYFTSYGYVVDINKKWTIDFAGSISLNQFDNNSENKNLINKISNNQLLSENLNRVNNNGRTLTFSNAVQGKLKIDSLGSEWTNDIYYSINSNKADQSFNTSYYSPFLINTGGDGDNENNRKLFTVQSDLKLKRKKRLTIETGIKSSLLDFKNTADYFRENSSVRTKDSSRTSAFNYKENINAFYLQGSKTFGKDIVLKVGARLENTNMEGRQLIPKDTTFELHRTDLFPYVYLSKSLMRIAGYDLRAYLVYRRTISRPVYEQLNPFPKYIDEYLSEIGNPSLRPQFTQNYEANISVDERPILAVGVNDTRDIFSIVTYQSDTTQSKAYRTYDNLGKNKEWYLRGLGALPPGGRYFFVLGAQYNHNFYQGIYEGQPLSFKKGTWTFFTYQTFKIDKRSVITLNGFVRLKGQQQLYELGSFGALNTSVNRKFFKEKLIATISLNDMFATNRNNFILKQGSVNASGFRQSDTRRFGLNLRYNFGIRKKEDSNNMFNVESPEKTN